MVSVFEFSAIRISLRNIPSADQNIVVDLVSRKWLKPILEKCEKNYQRNENYIVSKRIKINNDERGNKS